MKTKTKEFLNAANRNTYNARGINWVYRPDLNMIQIKFEMNMNP